MGTEPERQAKGGTIVGAGRAAKLTSIEEMSREGENV